MKEDRNSYDNTDLKILSEIRFGFLHPYKVAGMGEPWVSKLSRTLKLLKDFGIGAILTLTEDDIYGKDYLNNGFIHLHVPIDDCEAPSREDMDRSISFIDSCLDRNEGVAVHCAEGRGRTGTVLGAWLAGKESLDPANTIKRLFELRIHTALTESQKFFLYDYIGG